MANFTQIIGVLNSTSSSVTMDATTTKYAMIGRFPAGGSVNKVWLRTGTVTSAQSLTVSLFALDASGVPTGAALGTGTIATPTASTWHTVTLNAPVVYAANAHIAVVIEWTGTTGTLTLAVGTAGGTGGYRIPFATGAWGAKSNGNIAIVGVELSDTSKAYVLGFHPVVTNVGTTFNSGTTAGSGGDERGNKILVPMRCQIIGVYVGMTISGTTSDFNLRIYDALGNTLATYAVSAAAQPTAVNGVFNFPVPAFWAAAGQVLYVTLMPTTTNNVVLNFYDLPDATFQAATDGATSIYGVLRTDGGAWTDFTTRKMSLALVIGQIENSGKRGIVQ